MSQMQRSQKREKLPVHFAPFTHNAYNNKTRQGTIFLDTSHYGVEGDRLINGRLILRYHPPRVPTNGRLGFHYECWRTLATGTAWDGL